MAKVVPSVTKAWFGKRGFAEAGVVLDWPNIVGAEFAAFTCAERLSRDGRLRVRVGGAFGVELAHLEPIICDRVNSYFGYRAVKRMVSVHGTVAAPRKVVARRSRPLSREDETLLARSLEGTTDTDLRAALESLGRSILGHKRAPP